MKLKWDGFCDVNMRTSVLQSITNEHKNKRNICGLINIRKPLQFGGTFSWLTMVASYFLSLLISFYHSELEIFGCLCFI